MKTIIAGSRTFNNMFMMEEALKPLLGITTTIISGNAKGADKLGEEWADNHHIPIIKMPANWNTFGKSAGFRRNLEMGKLCDNAHIFWNGKSVGTLHMINIMKYTVKKPFTIHYFKEE